MAAVFPETSYHLTLDSPALSPIYLAELDKQIRPLEATPHKLQDVKGSAPKTSWCQTPQPTFRVPVESWSPGMFFFQHIFLAGGFSYDWLVCRCGVTFLCVFRCWSWIWKRFVSSRISYSALWVSSNKRVPCMCCSSALQWVSACVCACVPACVCVSPLVTPLQTYPTSQHMTVHFSIII